MFLFIFLVFLFQKVKNIEFIKEDFHVVTFCCNKKIHKDGKPSRNGVLFRFWIRLMFSVYILISEVNPWPQFEFIGFLFFKRFTFSNL